MLENKRKRIEERDMVRTWTGGNETLLKREICKDQAGV
jgi:hypothetical protein